MDSTVDSSGYSLANHHHLRQEEEEEEEEAMVSHRETMNEVTLLFIYDSDYVTILVNNATFKPGI